MSWLKGISKIVGSILINIFSNDIGVVRDKKISKLKLQFHRRKVERWIVNYIKQHEDSILATGFFADFLKYHKPIEKLYFNILSINPVSNYIDVIVKECKEATVGTCKFDVNDEYAVRNFFQGLLDLSTKFFWLESTTGEKYTNYKINETKEKIIREVKRESIIIQHKEDTIIDQIVELRKILESSKPLNEQQITNIYNVLNLEIVHGHSGLVVPLLDLIENKDKELYSALACDLSIYSNFESLKKISELLGEITNNEILNDLVRKFAFVEIVKRGNLEWLLQFNVNIILKTIIARIINEGQSCLWELIENEENGVKCYEYKVDDTYLEEKAFVTKVCFAEMLYSPFINFEDIIENIDIDQEDIIICILKTSKIVEMMCQGILDKDAKVLFEEARDKLKESHKLPQFFKEIYDITFLRLALLCGAEAEEIALSVIDGNILFNMEIRSLVMQIKINKHIASEDEVLALSSETGNYWLLSNFLSQNYMNHPQVICRFFSVHQELLGKNDITLFLLYARATVIVLGKKEASKVYDKYELAFAEYEEYWIDRIMVDSREEIMNCFVDRWQLGNLKSISWSTEEDLVKLLYEKEKYEFAIDVITKAEQLNKCTFVMTKIKASIYVIINKEIEALAIFEKILEKDPADETAIDNVLVLSINNKRDVDKEIIEKAANSSNSRLIMLAAYFSQRQNDMGEAEKLIVKSMLANNGENDKVYGLYLGIHTGKDNGEVAKISGVDENTAVYLSSEDERLIICIYKEHVLPKEPYIWENAKHIYKETAILQGLFRKKSGDNVEFDGKIWVIDEIMPLDCFLFRLSMAKLVGAGEAKEIHIPISDEGLNAEAFYETLKEYVGDEKDRYDWLIEYKDLDKITASLYLLKRYVNLPYYKFVDLLLDDNTIIFKDLFLPQSNFSCNNFILSFSTLVLLIKIGFMPDNSGMIKTYIPTSLNQEIFDETELTIKENNREVVARIGIYQGQGYLNQSSEDEKRNAILEAVRLKEYTKHYLLEENKYDIEIEKLKKINLKEVLGIADYDALAIAKNQDMIFVSSESVVTAIAAMDSDSIKVCNILDYIVMYNPSVKELIGYMRELIRYRYMIPLTDAALIYVLEQSANCVNEEKRESVYRDFQEMLEAPLESDGQYKNLFTMLITKMYARLYKKVDYRNDIWSIFIKYVLLYNGKEVKVYVNPNGEMQVKVQDIAIDT